jgi:TctA family transporter
MFLGLNGYGGFKVILDVGKITLYGIDPGPKLFVRCDGQEIMVTEKVDE